MICYAIFVTQLIGESLQSSMYNQHTVTLLVTLEQKWAINFSKNFYSHDKFYWLKYPVNEQK